VRGYRQPVEKSISTAAGILTQRARASSTA
jgi:hypothetical protein